MKQISAATVAKYVKTTNVIFTNTKGVKMIVKAIFAEHGLETGLYVYKIEGMDIAKPFAKIVD